MYRRDLDGWINYKLVALGRAKRKANYWISFSKVGRLGFDGDVLKLKVNRPELYACLKDFIEGYDPALGVLLP